LEKALGKAVNWCIEHDILKDFLEENSTEVNNMLFTEWNWDDALEVAREEGKEEARAEGIEVGIDRGIDNFYELLEQGYAPKEAREMLKNKSRVEGLVIPPLPYKPLPTFLIFRCKNQSKMIAPAD
ncbi:MAG: hypothetical protein LBV68_02685, partial [Spirochaetaceae bacterium]|nr:hypothetical protein [Spirochaetaceae bacterium]